MELCNGARYDEHTQVVYEGGSCPVCEASLEASRLKRELEQAEEHGWTLAEKITELKATIEALRTGSVGLDVGVL